MRILALILGLVALPVTAHELWIEPTAYQVAADGSLEAHIVNGQEFKGTKLPYLPQKIANFVLFSGTEAARVRGRAGDRPALQQDPVAEGLNIVAYQANIATLNYENWEKFQKFLDHKDLGELLPRHRERGLPEENFGEVYSRYSKSLIAVGHGEGADRRVGLETEIVALTNPYTDDLSDGFRLQLFYREDARANEQVEIFEKAPDGSVIINLYRTDDQGIAIFPARPGHSYMADAVVLREPSEQRAADTGMVWETLWANLTFAVPE